MMTIAVFAMSRLIQYLHLLIDCQIVVKIWDTLFQFISEVSGVLLRPTRAEIMLGVNENNLSTFYNTIMIICKQYIYASRCLGKRPCAKVLLQKIKFERKLEHMAALRKNQLQHWNAKWALFESLDID